MFEKKKTKTHKHSKSSKQDEEESKFRLTPGLTFNKRRDFLLNPNVWIADSAALNHMTPHSEGMMNIQNITTEATWGNKTTNKATMS